MTAGTVETVLHWEKLAVGFQTRYFVFSLLSLRTGALRKLPVLPSGETVFFCKSTTMLLSTSLGLGFEVVSQYLFYLSFPISRLCDVYDFS